MACWRRVSISRCQNKPESRPVFITVSDTDLPPGQFGGMAVASVINHATAVAFQTEPMKIAIATDDYVRVAGHAGQAARWLLFDCAPRHDIGEPVRIELSKPQIFHHWESTDPHPLDGIEIIVARSAGDGFLRRMQKRGVDVLLTSEALAEAALLKILAGEALPDPRWDVSLALCRLRDLFSRH